MGLRPPIDGAGMVFPTNGVVVVVVVDVVEVGGVVVVVGFVVRDRLCCC